MYMSARCQFNPDATKFIRLKDRRYTYPTSRAIHPLTNYTFKLSQRRFKAIKLINISILARTLVLSFTIKYKSIKQSNVVATRPLGKSNPFITYKYCGEFQTSNAIKCIEDYIAQYYALLLNLQSRYNRQLNSGLKLQIKLLIVAYTISRVNQKAYNVLLAKAIYSSSIPFSFIRILKLQY